MSNLNNRMSIAVLMAVIVAAPFVGQTTATAQAERIPGPGPTDSFNLMANETREYPGAAGGTFFRNNVPLNPRMKIFFFEGNAINTANANKNLTIFFDFVTLAGKQFTNATQAPLLGNNPNPQGVFAQQTVEGGCPNLVSIDFKAPDVAINSIQGVFSHACQAQPAMPPAVPPGRDRTPWRYDIAGRSLSSSGGIFTESPFPNDPIVGASVNIPTMTIIGEVSPGEISFINQTTDEYSITSSLGTFLRADLEGLAYLIDQNTFYWALSNLRLSGVSASSPFFDPTLPDLGSQFISSTLESTLNPASPNFIPGTLPYLTFIPNVNVFSESSGFTRDLSFDSISVIGPARSIPEPSTLILFGIGGLGLLGCRRTRVATV